jgi:hypothetical protein
MAFTALPPGKRGGSKPVTNEVYVGVFAGAGKTLHTSISIPRAVYREAGLPDYPGATFDILIGEGADRGSVALIAGSRFRAQKVGSSDTPHRMTVGSALLSGASMKSTAVRYEAGRKQLIVHMPAGFVWRDTTSDETARPARELVAA